MTKKDWTVVKVSDCCDQISERVDNPSESGFERFVGLDHMKTREVTIRNWGNSADVTSAMKLFQDGDVLVARRNVYLERAATVRFAGVCSGDAIVLRTKAQSPCITELLPFILNTDQFWGYANSQADGSMSKRLSVARLLDYEFPLPPIDEQRRIAELLWAADDVIESLKKSLEKLLVVDSSMRFDFFSAEKDKVNLGDLVADNRLSYKTGPFGTVLKASSYVDTGVPVVNPVNMKDGDFFVEDGPFISEQEVERLAVYKIIENDLIFGRKGDIGRGIFSSQQHEGYIVGSDCIRIRVLGNEIIPKYLFYFLTSPASKRLLASYSHGTTMPGINEKMLSKMEVHIPEKQEQREITNKLKEIDKAKSQLMSKIEMSYELKRNLLTNLLMG